jgi:outer membrane protein
MKVSTVASTLLGVILVAGLASAQQPPVQKPPVPKPPVQQTPPAQPPAAQPPAAQTPAPAVPAPTAKFPDGAKYAYINIQAIAGSSAEGKASTARLEALRTKKANELAAKNKSVEDNQKKLTSSVLAADVQAQIQRDIDKAQVDIQRMTQDAQSELQELQNELQLDFQRKLGPVVQQLAVEKGLHILFSQTDSGIVWADPGLDLTAELIRRFDAAMATAKPKAPTAAPKQ